MKIRIMSLLLGIVGEILIAALFFWVIPDALPTNILVLDFVVVSLVYWLWIYNILKPAVNFKEPSHKQVGGLGVRWISLSLYTFLAVGFVVYTLWAGITGEIPLWDFPVLVIIQAGLLFFLCGGLITSEHIMQKTKDIYEEQKVLKTGKHDVKKMVQQLLFVSEDTSGIPHDIKERLKKIAGETRYLSPSVSEHCIALDADIIKNCDTIIAALADYDLNKKTVTDQIDSLERNLERRRRAM